MKIAILANHYNTLRIFRRELLKKLAEFHEVWVSLPPCDEENRKLLESYGVKVVFTQMSRRGLNPLSDIRLFFEYIKLLRKFKPDKVICYTVKCNIYGAWACKTLHLPHYVNITGLGTPLEKGGVVGFIVSTLYRYSLNKAGCIFLENAGDRDRLVRKNIVHQEQTQVMPGAGVNLEEFAYTDYPEEEGEVRFLFIGRVMQEKGVDELFVAIKKIKDEGMPARFDFIGWYEEQYEEQVKELVSQGYISFYGFQKDVRPFIVQCHCSILPSWHEGMSNTLLESASMGRPLITTDVHGCLEAVEDGVTGYLVPRNDPDAICSAIRRFIQLPHAEKIAMGQKGRARMQEIFDKEKVVELTLKKIGLSCSM